jgi:hypothetical protein
MVNDRRHSSEQVLPRSLQERFSAGAPPTYCDPAPVPTLDVFCPGRGVLIGRAAKPSVVVAVKMVVTIDQAGPDVSVTGVNDDIEATLVRDDVIALQSDCCVARLD